MRRRYDSEMLNDIAIPDVFSSILYGKISLLKKYQILLCQKIFLWISWEREHSINYDTQIPWISHHLIFFPAKSLNLQLRYWGIAKTNG